MPNFQLSSLDDNTTPKKILKLVYFFIKNLRKNNWKIINTKKSIEVFKINVLNGRFVLFEIVKNHQSWKTVLVSELSLWVKHQKAPTKIQILKEEKNITSEFSWKYWTWHCLSFKILILEGVLIFITKESLTLNASQKSL